MNERTEGRRGGEPTGMMHARRGAHVATAMQTKRQTGEAGRPGPTRDCRRGRKMEGRGRDDPRFPIHRQTGTALPAEIGVEG